MKPNDLIADCDHCQSLLGDYLHRRLDTTQHAGCQRHLDQCPDCRRALAAERRLDAALASRPLKETDLDFTALVMARLEQPQAQADGHWWLAPLAWLTALGALALGLVASGRLPATHADFLPRFDRLPTEAEAAGQLPAFEPVALLSLLPLPPLPDLGSAQLLLVVGSATLISLGIAAWALHESLVKESV